MRYFTLSNNLGDMLDITSKSIFFSEVSGLGFEEDTSFRSVGEVWWLNTASYRQKAITGKLIFTNLEGSDPYGLFSKFLQFIKHSPLILNYYPYGLNGKGYHKRVRVTKLEKSELTKYGVLEESIDFTPYTPWYETIERSNNGEGESYAGAWIWGDGDQHPPVVFDPTPLDATPPRFGSMDMKWVDFDISACDDSPARFIIFGPVTNPIWTHYVDGKTVGTGEFSGAVTVTSSEALVIDNTGELNQIKIYESYVDENGQMCIGAEKRDLYQKRNFNTKCFITLQPGKNRIAVSSSETGFVKMRLEGQIYNAAV